MTRAARVYVLAVMVVVYLAGPGTSRPRAFFGLDPASWIVVAQMSSAVSNLLALRDTMMRIRDEALHSYRGLVAPLDDFSGQMRRALGEGGRIDFTAFNQQNGLADPRTIELADCPDPLPADASAVCRPTALPAAGTAYRDLDSLTPEQVTGLEEAHALRAAEFELKLGEADHRERLAEEALVAIALYSGCEDDQDDADRRGVVACPSSRSWTADEREGLQGKLQDSIADLNTVDCPAGTGACPSQAQHRSLMLAVAQAEANMQALWLKLDAEEADGERRDAERELLEEARLEAVKVARLQALADFNVDPDTVEGADLLFPTGLDGQTFEPITVRPFIYGF